MESPLTIGLYSPYVPEHCGGGERYFFQVACSAVAIGHRVIILVSSHPFHPDELRKKYESAFGLDLSGVEFQATSIGTSSPWWKKLKETRQFDVLYYLTDGSLFFSLAKKNIVHIQFPFTFSQKGLLNRLKLLNWSIRNANSAFTKRIVSRAWKTTIQFVHYPAIDTRLFLPAKKEQTILSVGRFFSGEKSGLHCKRQDLMVEAFRHLIDSNQLSGWKLVLIGSIDPGEDNVAYAQKVHDRSKSYPIKIFHEADFSLLKKYYGQAKIYWHAAGVEVDEEKEPTKVEHFGIAPLEAMSAGAVPVVVAKGGLKESVRSGVDGYLWNSVSELEDRTMELVHDEGLLHKMSDSARKRANQFGLERFSQTLQDMLSRK